MSCRRWKTKRCTEVDVFPSMGVGISCLVVTVVQTLVKRQLGNRHSCVHQNITPAAITWSFKWVASSLSATRWKSVLSKRYSKRRVGCPWSWHAPQHSTSPHFQAGRVSANQQQGVRGGGAVWKEGGSKRIGTVTGLQGWRHRQKHCQSQAAIRR